MRKVAQLLPGQPLPEFPRISDYVRHYAAQFPDREATVLGERRMTYGELGEHVDRCARALHAVGIGKGDRVAMLSTPRPEFLVVFLATIRTGAIWLGLNPRHTFGELQYVTGDSQPTVLFSLREFEGRDFVPDLERLKRDNSDIKEVVTLQGGVPGLSLGLDEFLAGAPAVPDSAFREQCDRVDAADPAVIVYTSGSTGKPKGALLSHRGFVRCYRIQYEHWPADPLRVLNNLPINHIGSVGDISSFTVMAGGTLIFMERFRPEQLLEVIERERITWTLQIPTMYQLALSHPAAAKYDLSSLQAVIWGGAAAPIDLIRGLAKLGARLYTSYGLTESVGSVTYTDEGADLSVLENTIGRPEARFELRLAGPNGTPVALGDPGEIQLRGDFVMLGYFNRVEATAETIDADGWVRTGDLAIEREDGNLVLAGRLKEMFKSGGYNVYPREIEAALESHPAVAMAAVVAVPDTLYSEVGHGFVLPRPGLHVDVEELRLFCAEHLANYKIPKQFHVLKELPMLPVGKIDKQSLRKRALESVSPSTH